jgi:predicted lipid-binding transport protein (Tim44 family)
MKKAMLSMLIAVSAMSLMVADADARRLGGGGSFGRQSSNVYRQAAPASSPYGRSTQSAPQPAAPVNGAAGMPAPARPASPLRGMLGGALLGLGAGALLSHFGLGGAMGGMFGSILMLALLAFAAMFLFRLFRSKNQPLTSAPAYGNDRSDSFIAKDAPFTKSMTPEIGSGLTPVGNPNMGAGFGAGSTIATTAASTNAGTWSIPAGFDVPSFLRNAKTYFIRLQAAWDKADLNDIREFTSTEMFAEFRLELQERGASSNLTDVVKLDAEMLGVETSNTEHLASVKFTGLIKEDAAADATPFAEVWNLSKPINDQSGWVLAGIQQI